MSTNSSPTQKQTIFLKKMPIILKKKQFVISGDKLINISQTVFKEDVIYESKIGDFLRGEDRVVTIVNKLNRVTNNSVTIAKCLTPTNVVIEKTSERISNLIGQKNYDTLFSALCSVISQDLKVRGILALLTVNNSKDTTTQTGETGTSKRYKDSSCQTDESRINLYPKSKPRKRLKRQALVPYVAKTVEKHVKKIVINPDEYKDLEFNDLAKDEGLDDLICENSNESIGNLSSLSILTTNTLLNNPIALINNVDKHTKQDSVAPENIPVHKEMPEVLSPKSEIIFGQMVVQDPIEKKRLASAQALLDWTSCIEADEDGNLPIHEAVKNNDLALLLRQCLVLTARKRSVDEPANGDWTALKMAILKNHSNMTSILLRFGANPLLTDSEEKTSIHHAAEMPHEHLKAIVENCMTNPRRILEQNDELWHEDYTNMPDDRLARLLLVRMCSMCDLNGYTPLMLASKLGLGENVETLVRIAPSTINKQMPTSGNTALFLSVGAACTDCLERGDKTVVSPNFRRTIEALVENGADPSIVNHSGSNVNILLTEFNIAPLSTLVANKLTMINCFNGLVPETTKSPGTYIIIKNSEGTMNIKEVEKKKSSESKSMKNGEEKGTREEQKRSKPVILENFLLSPAGQSKRPKTSEKGEFVNVFKKIINVGAEDLVEKGLVKAGKAGVIMDLKIESRIPAIRQPPKKRIKTDKMK
ncbi:hypothetical protein O3G_MSEX003071 [Manduca sexta]|uniref:Uncharacterized protein n=1 Tax=Manduca sexta TaxID=7130 RepID=A0A921YQG4_MANSE|nr:hypothetical protein O3G_MSEX003071 [Manduca sexta]